MTQTYTPYDTQTYHKLQHNIPHMTPNVSQITTKYTPHDTQIDSNLPNKYTPDDANKYSKLQQNILHMTSKYIPIDFRIYPI